MWMHDEQLKVISDDEFVARIRIDLGRKSSWVKQTIFSIGFVGSIVIVELLNARFAQSFLLRVVAGSFAGVYAIWFVDRRGLRLLLRYYDLAHELGRRMVTADKERDEATADA